MPITNPTGPPPLAGWVESSPGHWVPGSTGTKSGSIPSSSGGGFSTPLTSSVAAPSANFTYTVHAGGLVSFVNSSIGIISAYSWYFGDGIYASSPSVLHQYIGSGTFPVTLTVKNSTGQSSKTLNVTIAATPIPESVDFSFSIGALGVQFTDTSTKAGTRNWSFGDGTTSTETSPYKLYVTPGIYIAALAISGVSKSYQVPVDYGIVLQWQDNSSDETGFKVERSPNGTTGWTLIATVGAGIEILTVTKNLHGVDPSVENHFRVYAYKTVGGDSGYSNVAETLCGG